MCGKKIKKLYLETKLPINIISKRFRVSPTIISKYLKKEGYNMKNFLEYNINQMINFINNNNLGYGFKLHPERNYKGVYISGESFDYIIMTPANIFCFDAKQTISDRWSLKKKDKKQAINLMKVSKFNIKSFFLIYFIKQNKLMKLDIENLFNILNKRKYVKMSDCETFDYKEMFKIGLSNKKK